VPCCPLWVQAATGLPGFAFAVFGSPRAVVAREYQAAVAEPAEGRDRAIELRQRVDDARHDRRSDAGLGCERQPDRRRQGLYLSIRRVEPAGVDLDHRWLADAGGRVPLQRAGPADYRGRRH